MDVNAEPEDELGPGRVADLSEVFAAASAGDQAAWDELVHRLGGLVWSICRSYRLDSADAADVFQFTWLRLLDKMDTIQDPMRLPAWLATTTRRECAAMYRRRSRVVYLGEAEKLDRLAGRVEGSDLPVLTSQRDSALWEAFFKLGAVCQRILWVLVVDPPEGSSYAAASERLSLPMGSLGPKRGRCLEQLRKHLEAMGITDIGALA
jgi:RNA polymerase sigma factor (sigma-70 family)